MEALLGRRLYCRLPCGMGLLQAKLDRFGREPGESGGVDGPDVVILEGVLDRHLPVGIDHHPITIELLTKRASNSLDGRPRFSQPIPETLRTLPPNENQLPAGFNLPFFQSQFFATRISNIREFLYIRVSRR